MLLQYCVRLLQEFEDRLDFKCNVREVIEVHRVHVSRNYSVCFVKIFTLT